MYVALEDDVDPPWYYKSCTRCGKRTHVNDFHLVFARPSQCRRCNEEHGEQQTQLDEERRLAKARQALRAEERRLDKKRQARERRLQTKYHITAAQFDALLEIQGRRCAICRTKDPGSRGWVVDHDHESGQLRGILCSKCNTGLGLFGDDADGVHAALVYLMKTEDPLASIGVVREKEAEELS